MLKWESDGCLMPPLSTGGTLGDETDEARQARYQLYLDFYNGLQWNERRRAGERRLTVNYARTFVQKSASYLLGKPVKFELIPTGSDQAAFQTEERLKELWEQNGLYRVDYDAAVDAAVLGDGAFKVTLQTADTANKLGLDGGVTVRAVDVLNLQAAWREADMRRLAWVCETYEQSAGQAREVFGTQTLSQRGFTKPVLADSTRIKVTERWTDSRYIVEIQGKLLIDKPNPYGFVPYVIFPNLSRPRQCWGLSDLEDILSLNSEFNVRISVLSQLLQMSGNPVLVLENVEGADNLRIGPGAIWTLPEGAHASLLEMIKDGGVDLHIKYIDLLYKMMHDLAELPSAGFGRDDGNSLRSGAALEILLHPVSQRVNRKRRIWDEVLDLRNRMMLVLAGLPIYRSRIVWPEVLPRDRAALVTQEVGLVSANIHSLDTARRNLGDEQPQRETDTILAERTAFGVTNGDTGGIRSPLHLSGALVEGLSKSGG